MDEGPLDLVSTWVRVLYRSGGIKYRDSPTASINFGPEQLLISGSVNDVTSSKDLWTDEMVVLASNSTTIQGRIMTLDPSVCGNGLLVA